MLAALSAGMRIGFGRGQLTSLYDDLKALQPTFLVVHHHHTISTSWVTIVRLFSTGSS
jgi:hypothetical protein